MRLTTDLISKSPQFFNGLSERELDLRGHKISAIENLGAARDNDTIDFTDNEIAQLENFPLNPRLRSLLLAHNRITSIQPNLATAIPNLTTLVLTNNRLVELADLDPLSGFTKLEFLSLIGNPVTNKEHYRYWVIWRVPSVRFFDFAKVGQREREKANELFGTSEKPTELALQIMQVKSKGFVVPSLPNETTKKRILTDVEKRKMIAAIKNAKTLDEMVKLEKDFEEGRIPGYVLDAPEPMEM